MRKLLLFLFLLSLSLSVVQPSFALTISVFDNSSYVDTGGAYNNESDTVQATLTTLGHTVLTFTGITGSAFSSAANSADLILIPELEQTSSTEFNTWMTNAKTDIQSYVSGGGGLVIMGSSWSDNFINEVFGFSTTYIDLNPSASIVTTNAAGTTFEGGPSTLQYWSWTQAARESSLPSNATSMYKNTDNEVPVFVSSFGSGSFAFVGWDWYNAKPLGGYDSSGDWAAVLDNSVNYVAGAPVPEPATMLLLGSGLVGLAGLRRRFRKK